MVTSYLLFFIGPYLGVAFGFQKIFLVCCAVVFLLPYAIYPTQESWPLGIIASLKRELIWLQTLRVVTSYHFIFIGPDLGVAFGFQNLSCLLCSSIFASICNIQ